MVKGSTGMVPLTSARKTLPSSYMSEKPHDLQRIELHPFLRSINAYLGPAAGRSDTKSLRTSPALLFAIHHRLPVIYRDQSSSKAQASVDTARTDATAEPTDTAHQLNVLGYHDLGQCRKIQASAIFITELGNSEHVCKLMFEEKFAECL
ncbi:unnamed protein product [Fusarium venenatum]|uniref:Uncharacterized protein n=1 Tax=Fusarium venenatum TaxID=56646 RepID=A0A2L2T467_9HYPO|nr:LOW QUALITY PROTEIN: uncharacterized protein FVRRES_00881 [Fusarium venenatum]CEI64369.1 unnamed protein product [Fusarium venenatum]